MFTKYKHCDPYCIYENYNIHCVTLYRALFPLIKTCGPFCQSFSSELLSSTNVAILVYICIMCSKRLGFAPFSVTLLKK